MPAITSLEIENFRCFERLRVEGLTQVSLIVGANNSGKTALLEAIEALASETSPFVGYRASLSRGEFRAPSNGGQISLDVRHWFFGHALDAGVSFRVRGSGERRLEVSRIVTRVPPDAPSPPFVPAGLRIGVVRDGDRQLVPELPITADGHLGAGEPSTFADHGLRLRPPVGFVTTDRLSAAQLATLWARIVLTPREDLAVKALRLVEPTVDRVAIFESGGAASAQVLLKGASGPVPLGTLGEGVSRMLTLALLLVQTEHGFLLIDEIENGLHWSIMPRVWSFLVETARAFNVQVVATTHSKDCIEAIAALSDSAPELAEHLSVHRLERGHDRSTRLDASRVAEYVAMDLETR